MLSFHVVMGMLRIPVAVDVHLLTAFFVAVEVLAVSFRILDLTYLPEAVVAVSNSVSVRIRGAGDVAGIVVGVVFHASFRRMDLQDPSPAVQNEIRPVPIPVRRPGHVPPGVMLQSLGCPALLGIAASPVYGQQVSGQAVFVFGVDGLCIQL